MIRALILTLLLIAAGLFLTLPATAGLFADVDTYRSVVLWGIPAAALVLSFLLFPGWRALPGISRAALPAAGWRSWPPAEPPSWRTTASSCSVSFPIGEL